MMEIVFAPQALEDLTYWQKTGNVAIIKRIQLLLEIIREQPYEGIGKQEP